MTSGSQASGELPSEDLGSSLETKWLQWLERWRRWNHTKVWLELWQGNQRIAQMELSEGRCRIGREPLCELPLEFNGLSRIHCFVEKECNRDRDYTLVDFNSANGIFWRDRRISALQLRNGDEIQLGSPLKGQVPSIKYFHPYSIIETIVRWSGIGILVASGVGLSVLMLATTIAGGSKIRAISGPIKIYSANHQQIDAKEGSSTALASLQDYPLHLRQALVDSEEARFGWNSGLDLFGTLRSFIRKSGGGSGITQQVARMYYPSVGNDYSITRKLRELWVAWQLETGFSKNEILKMYLDRAYLGLGSEGFEQASRLYFRKSAKALDVPESAFLVGLLPNPNGYSPCNSKDPKAGRERRDLVLQLMHQQGHLNDQQLIDAKRRPLNIDSSSCRESDFTSYPFFSDYVMGELEGRRFGLNIADKEIGGNYYVESTIDPRLQQIAQQHLQSFLDSTAKPSGLNQGALISLEISTGEILAYVGGGNYKHSSFDRVQALRQPGSTFKLFAFLKALEAGVEPGDLVSCSSMGYVAGCSHGPSAGSAMTMRDGFAYSENVVALRMAEKASYSQVVEKARQLGISTKLDESYGMVLGGNETYLYEMARAYAVVANAGKTVSMHGVNKIYDLGICKSIYSLSHCSKAGVTIPIGEKSQPLVASDVAFKMDSMLRRVVELGTGRNAGVIPDARGKTGTTNHGVDVLFIGYSPSMNLLTAIWMGNDDNKPAEYATSALAAELWGKYMTAVRAAT